MTDSNEDFGFSLLHRDTQQGCPCCFLSGDRQLFGSTLHLQKENFSLDSWRLEKVFYEYCNDFQVLFGYFFLFLVEQLMNQYK